MGGGKIVFVAGIEFFFKQKLGHLIAFSCHEGLGEQNI